MTDSPLRSFLRIATQYHYQLNFIYLLGFHSKKGTHTCACLGNERTREGYYPLQSGVQNSCCVMYTFELRESFA
jgi:hypothetical protein